MACGGVLFMCAVAIALVAVNGCKTIEDCNLNGECTNGKCSCEPAWVGDDCGVLNLLPAPKDSGFNLNMSSSWGGGVLLDSKGLYHMYMALMYAHCGLDSWQHNSLIAHAIGKTPLGPFIYQENITSYFAHNPQPFQAPDGTYVIFHIGCGNDPKSFLFVNCTNGTTPTQPSPNEQKEITESTDSSDNDCWAVRALSSTSLEGPWTDKFLFSTVVGQPFPKGTDNPTAYFYPNGSVLVLFRSYERFNTTTKQTWIGSATAPSWKGPYTVSPSPLFEVNQEDPFIWRDHKNGYFHALLHTQVSSPVGRHAFSMDGVTWKLSETAAYSQNVTFDDGTWWWYQRRERPQLFFDPTTMTPIVLYNGVQPNANDRTYTLAVPIFSGK